jgi:hypothetical protein
MLFLGSRIRRHLAHDSYLTDGVTLIRVVSLADTGASQLAWIEDCLTLKRWAVSGKELEGQGWRRVRPTRAETVRRTVVRQGQTGYPQFFIDSRPQESPL